MKFLDEIKKQSLAVRQIMFGLCVVTTISLVGMIWYRSFETKLYVLMDHQPQVQEDSVFLARDDSSPGLFASLSEALGSMKAAALGLFRVFNGGGNSPIDDNAMTGEVHKFPLSGDK